MNVKLISFCRSDLRPECALKAFDDVTLEDLTEDARERTKPKHGVLVAEYCDEGCFKVIKAFNIATLAGLSFSLAQHLDEPRGK